MILFQGGSSNTIGHTNDEQGDDVPPQQPRKKILFYNLATFQLARNIKMRKDILTNCEVNSCEITFDRKDANCSDALIIHHRNMRSHKPSRPSGQIWIMIQHEASCTYSKRHSTDYQVNCLCNRLDGYTVCNEVI